MTGFPRRSSASPGQPRIVPAGTRGATRIVCQPSSPRRRRTIRRVSRLCARTTGLPRFASSARTCQPAPTTAALSLRQPFAPRCATTTLPDWTYATYGVPFGPSAIIPSCTPRATSSAEAEPAAARASPRASTADRSMATEVSDRGGSCRLPRGVLTSRENTDYDRTERALRPPAPPTPRPRRPTHLKTRESAASANGSRATKFLCVALRRGGRCIADFGLHKQGRAFILTSGELEQLCSYQPCRR